MLARTIVKQSEDTIEFASKDTTLSKDLRNLAKGIIHVLTFLNLGRCH
ncbi:MAG: hypothetical protein JSS09_03430 [Verrucomicrobia bacterium]|nr:hypothetical protein [Verrucomicrobiota bacterium]